MRNLVVPVLAAAACAHASRVETPASLALGRQDEAYLAADEVRTLSLQSPGGPLLVSCGMTGEGSYARVEVRQGADLLARGTCGDRIRVPDASGGPLTVTVRAFGGPGALRLLADLAPDEPGQVEMPTGEPPEHELARALRNRDETALDALLTEDFSATVGGKALDKHAFLESVRRDAGMDAEPQEVRARVHGQTAAVTFRLGAQAVTDTWVVDGGRWRLLTRQR